MQLSCLVILATVGVVAAAAIPDASAEIDIPRSPAPNVIRHDYDERSAEIDIPRSPAPNVIRHDYDERSLNN